MYDEEVEIMGSPTRFIYYNVSCTWLPLSGFGLNYSYYDEHWNLHEGSNITYSWEFSEDENHKVCSMVAAPAFVTKFLDNFNSTSFGPRDFRLSDGEVTSNSVATIALIKLAPRSGSVNKSFLNTAKICVLSVCAKRYNISMTSGLLQSEVISTAYSKMTSDDDSSMSNSGNSSITFVFPNNINNLTVAVKKTNGFPDFESQTWKVLQEILEGSLLIHIGSSGDESEVIAKRDTFQIALNASTDISKTMDRVAEAMTNRLRDMSSHTVQGQSGFMELYIRTSWWWLFLPVSCVIFETILLISVMITTRKHKMPIWKASELALFFHGLDFSIDDTQTQKASEMEDIASALQLRLARGSKGILKKLERKLE